MPSPAGPETNNFRCNACGRYFNTQDELSEHETECRRAKMSTTSGASELSREGDEAHEKNDHESTRDTFLHGTKK
jgi:hypothetical protein